MHILIAPNAFKNSISATIAAEAIRDGLILSKLNCTCECFPVADGGDGTASLLIEKLKGTIVYEEVYDPLGRSIVAPIGLIDQGNTAVIEMAGASGIRLLKPEELDPLQASSYGTGQLIKLALDKGVKKIIIAMGGSATVDGGIGILNALGIRFLDSQGSVLSVIPAVLGQLDDIDLSQLDKRIEKTEIVVLCDVDNMMLGKQGAARVFGPQKGASAKTILQLEAALAKFADIVFRKISINISKIKHGGTAGGAAAGLYGLLGASLVNGADFFLHHTGFEAALHNSDLVITGEGSIDEQTLQGKAPFKVACEAKKKGIPVIALAGKVPLKADAIVKDYFDIIFAISHKPDDLPTLLSCSEDNLLRTSVQIGNLLALYKKIS